MTRYKIRECEGYFREKIEEMMQKYKERKTGEKE